MSYVGKQFSTGNSTVRNLPVGTTLRVSGTSMLEVTSIPAPPKPVFNAGDRVRIVSKGRVGNIFRATTNGSAGVSGQPPKGYQFYVSQDAPYVVREAAESDLVKF